MKIGSGGVDEDGLSSRGRRDFLYQTAIVVGAFFSGVLGVERAEATLTTAQPHGVVPCISRIEKTVKMITKKKARMRVRRFYHGLVATITGTAARPSVTSATALHVPLTVLMTCRTLNVLGRSLTSCRLSRDRR